LLADLPLSGGGKTTTTAMHLMSDHYDSLETRDPAQREREQCARLPEIVARAMSAPGWARHLTGVDPKSVTSGAALAKLPVLRKSDLATLQKDHPPFGGLNVTPPGKVKRLLMSPGPIFEPQGEGADAYGTARALYAAGFRAGDIVHNSFAYHLTPGGFIIETGAHALGCAVIPGGVGNTEQQVEAIAHYKPSGYGGSCSTPPRRPAKTRPRSSARWSPARRCRPRCATSFPGAALPCCNAMRPRSLASSLTRALPMQA